MNFENLTKEEAELMSYKDLSLLLLNNNTMSTLELFQEIVKKLELNPSIIEDKIGDYFTMLSSHKDFILLDEGKWDLSKKYNSKHKRKFDSDDDLEEEFEEKEDDEEIIENYDEDFDELEDIEEDDFRHLTIVEDEDWEDE